MFDDFGNIFSQPQQYLGESKGHYLNNGLQKIISGLPNQKPIDFNGFEKELGYIDVEKLANDKYPKLSVNNITDKTVNKIFIEGFNTHKQLSDKDFSESDMIEFGNYVRHIIPDDSIIEKEHIFDWWSKHQPKQFQIEVEETENSFKIIKICQ